MTDARRPGRVIAEIFLDETWPPGIAEALRFLHHQVEVVMATQAELDNAVSVFGAFLTDVSAQITRVSGLLTANGLDASALDALVAQVPAIQTALDAVGTAPSGTTTDPAGGDTGTDPSTPTDPTAPAGDDDSGSTDSPDPASNEAAAGADTAAVPAAG